MSRKGLTAVERKHGKCQKTGMTDVTRIDMTWELEIGMINVLEMDLMYTRERKNMFQEVA